MPLLSRRASGVVTLATVAAAIGCAHIRPLEGGDADKTPPELLAVDPADSSRSLGALPVLHLRFSEALQAPSVSAALRTYPALPRPDVRVHGTQVELRYRDVLPPDTTLVVVLGRALQDAPGRDNKLPRELWLVFATGDTLRGGAVYGRVTVKGKPEPQAVLRYEPVVAKTDSGTARRRPRYPVAATDTEGLFTMLGLPAATPFVLRAFVDRNASFDVDDGELAAAYPETLRLAPGEVRRGLEWNLVDPHEPGHVHGVVFNRTTVPGPIAVGLRALEPDTVAARTDTSAARTGTGVARTDTSAARAGTSPARADTAGARPGAGRPTGSPAVGDSLPVMPPGDWAAAYAALGDAGTRAGWQIVYASPRGDYSLRVAPGRHRLVAFVDASGDSLPGTHVTADSTQRAWEPLWVGGILEVAPGADVRPRAIDIDTPQ